MLNIRGFLWSLRPFSELQGPWFHLCFRSRDTNHHQIQMPIFQWLLYWIPLTRLKRKKILLHFLLLSFRKEKFGGFGKYLVAHIHLFLTITQGFLIFLGYSPTTNKTFRNHFGEDSSDISSAEVSKPQPVFFIISV